MISGLSSATSPWERHHCVKREIQDRETRVFFCFLCQVSFLPQHHFSQLQSDKVGLKPFEEPSSPILIIGFQLTEVSCLTKQLILVQDCVVCKVFSVELRSLFLLTATCCCYDSFHRIHNSSLFTCLRSQMTCF